MLVEFKLCSVSKHENPVIHDVSLDQPPRIDEIVNIQNENYIILQNVYVFAKDAGYLSKVVSFVRPIEIDHIYKL